MPVNPRKAKHPDHSNRFERRVGDAFHALAIFFKFRRLSGAVLALAVVFALATGAAQAHKRALCSTSSALPANTCAHDTRDDSNQTSVLGVDPIVLMQWTRGRNEIDDHRSPYRSLALLTGLMLALYIELTALHRILERLGRSQHS